jgi:hypothetical protein
VCTARRKALTAVQVEQIAARAGAGEAKAARARDSGVSRETLYQHLRALTADKVVAGPNVRPGGSVPARGGLGP